MKLSVVVMLIGFFAGSMAFASKGDVPCGAAGDNKRAVLVLIDAQPSTRGLEELKKEIELGLIGLVSKDLLVSRGMSEEAAADLVARINALDDSN
jgi:hypothetical protein